MVFLVAAGITSLFFINFCNLVYRCGCRSYWNGAAQACNVHHSTGPRCPWCVHGYSGAAIPFGSVLIAQAAAALIPRRLSVWARLAAALLAFPAVGGVAALVFGWLTGYWSS